MKKIFLLFVAVVMSATVMAQSYGLIKDEGGVTNVRKGPGTNYAIVAKRKDGQPIGFKSCNTPGWSKAYEIGGGEYDAFLGYISSSKIVVPVRKGEWKYVGEVKQEGGYTNIRSGAGTNYPVVDKVKDGSFILYSRKNYNGWYKVYTQKGAFRGYVSSSKIEAMESPGF